MHKGPGLFPRPLHALQQQLEQQQQWVQAIGKGARRHCDPHALFGPYRAFNMEVEAGVADVALVLCNDKVCGEYVWATVCDEAAEATAEHKRLIRACR